MIATALYPFLSDSFDPLNFPVRMHLEVGAVDQGIYYISRATTQGELDAMLVAEFPGIDLAVDVEIQLWEYTANLLGSTPRHLILSFSLYTVEVSPPPGPARVSSVLGGVPFVAGTAADAVTYLQTVGDTTSANTLQTVLTALGW